MKNKEEIIAILESEFSDIYCYNCEGNDKNAPKDFCEDCHRKYMNWSISYNTAERIANNIISD